MRCLETRECYSSINRNEIIRFSRKWIKLEKNHSVLSDSGPERQNVDGYNSLAMCTYPAVPVELKIEKYK